MSIVAEGKDVASCRKRKFGTRDDVPERGSSLHGQIVRNDTAMKGQFAAQYSGNPALRQAGRQVIDRGEYDVGGHDGGEIIVDQRPVWPDVRLQIREFTSIHRQCDMR